MLEVWAVIFRTPAHCDVVTIWKTRELAEAERDRLNRESHVPGLPDDYSILKMPILERTWASRHVATSTAGEEVELDAVRERHPEAAEKLNEIRRQRTEGE